MSFAYYANEIPVAKVIIRNYLILKCEEPEEYSGQFIKDCRENWMYKQERSSNRVFIEVYKQYLDCLDYFEDSSRPVSCTVFKRLLAKERKILCLNRQPAPIYEGKYGPMIYTTEDDRDPTDEMVKLVRAQESDDYYP
jgi:hypothetical protein